MTDQFEQLLVQYQSKGIFVDTNILLLLFVGGFDPGRIERFKRTQQFSANEYELLRGLLGGFKTIVTTPYVLTEVNNLSNKIPAKDRESYFAVFRQFVSTFDEKFLSSRSVCESPSFSRLGLTDAAIVELIAGKYLVLTDDLPLCQALASVNADTINFNHIRDWRLN